MRASWSWWTCSCSFLGFVQDFILLLDLLNNYCDLIFVQRSLWGVLVDSPLFNRQGCSTINVVGVLLLPSLGQMACHFLLRRKSTNGYYFWENLFAACKTVEDGELVCMHEIVNTQVLIHQLIVLTTYKHFQVKNLFPLRCVNYTYIKLAANRLTPGVFMPSSLWL